MKRFLLPLLFAPVLLTLAGNAQTPSAKSTDATTIPGLRAYRTWNVANKDLYTVPRATAYLCAGPSLVHVTANPHENTDLYRDAYIRVYVNGAGKNAFFSRGKAVFPVGSIIVKEKRLTPDAAPELLTVMVKRQKGFDAPNGDWEYFAVSGDATQILNPGQTAHCQKCHQAKKTQGYLFRDYLPLTVR